MKPNNVVSAEDIRRASRDTLVLKVIAGVTKAGVATDRRKEASRKACRGNWRHDH